MNKYLGQIKDTTAYKMVEEGKSFEKWETYIFLNYLQSYCLMQPLILFEKLLKSIRK